MIRRKAWLRYELPALLWLGFIFYVSLQPLPSDLLPPGISEALSESLPEPVSVHDLGHMLEFAVLGALLLRWAAWRLAGRGLWKVVGGALAAAVLSALADETIQYFTPGRAFELDDIALDSLAAATGIALAWGVRRLVKRDSFHPPPKAVSGER
jgi:VanZ family protein